MAPEASKGRSEKASDVWSFGILMAQLLTGELPWPNDGFFIPMRFIYMLGNDQTMVPTVTSLSPDAQEIVTWCCQREPAKRPTVDQLLAHSYFASVVSTASPLALRGPMKRRTDRGRASVPRSTDDSPPGLDRGLGRSGKAVVDSGAGASLPNKSHATSVTLFKFSAFSDLPPNTTRGNNDMVLDDRVNLGEEEEDCEVTDRIPDVSIEAPAEDTF
jgi:serine/threonine protein kinase